MSTEVSRGLASLEIEGNSFEIGAALGRHGAEIVSRYLVRTHAWAFVTSFRDSDLVRSAKALAEARFPRYLEELKGLAAGLGLAFDDVFAWNCRGDIWAMSPDGCTTVQIPGAEPVVAHNEDGDPGLRSGCVLATVRPESGRVFTAFVYPASLPGHTFAVNDAGLVMTVNNIRSRATGEGLPRMILTRALIDCGTLDQALGLVRQQPRAGAFHLTLAQAGEAEIVSVEFTHANVSARPVRRLSSHANHLVHDGMRVERQIVTASSRSRQERGDEMIAAAGGAIDPLTILRDTARAALPIHRMQPDDPDNENTLATAIFKIGADKVECAIYDAADSQPRFRFTQPRTSPA
ncbi:peptidase C45 [Aliidongia dinghuensis]|uniref:Peptidase C45 n=1 Tax=Aliidongia dinghuensis TaxID=1867774 RepID=A0A8J2Z151_9PROT|nr:C45 family peptidase [Aliidongia dinghuensis]GGF50389.1 peptidase C45 [Aliidongia dinghuensis]